MCLFRRGAQPPLALPYANKARPLPAAHAISEGVEVGLLCWLPVADVARIQFRGVGLYHAWAGLVWFDLRRYGRRRVFGMCVGEVRLSLVMVLAAWSWGVDAVMVMAVLFLVVVQRPEPLAHW